MKSLFVLWKKLAEESASWCDTSAHMDCKTVRVRTEHEGLSFITITLPDFGKDFQKSLDQGHVDRRLFSGFQRKGELPRFLGGFLDRVFCRVSGRLLTNPDIDAILAIRQLTLMFGKIALPCSDARFEQAMKGYVECEQDVRVADARRSKAQRADFQRVSAMLFADVFSEVDRKIYNMEVLPKHGPGLTADGLTGNSKYDQRIWTSRLEEILPAGEFLLPNWRYYDHLDRVDILEPGSERPVKVVAVPKTLKTPRIIAMEPVAMQYAQQGILALILDALSKNDTLDTIIGFDDQSPNQRMARIGSSDGSLATLDLSEASDRVSNQLVRDMLYRWPFLHRAVDASRSRKADVPGFGVQRLAKFASMGSALCFPFEAIVFTTIIFLGIEHELNRPLRPSDVKTLKEQVRIYGDDIIIPVDYVSSVVHMLELFGVRVNVSKSYWNGKFRESCGKEYYDNHDISIVKVRRILPTQRQDVAGIISTVSLRNQLYFAGYWQTVRWLDTYIEDLIHHFPVVLPSSPVQGRHSFLGYESQRFDDSLHRPLVKGLVVSARIPKNSLQDEGALLKVLLMGARSALRDQRFQARRGPRNGTPLLGSLPAVDEDHLERSGRPQAVNLKLGWNPPY